MQSEEDAKTGEKKGFHKKEEVLKMMFRKLFMLVAFLLIALPLSAQDKEQEEPPISIQAKVGAGGGSFFGEEDVAFDSEAAFAALQWYGVKLPIDGGSSGIGIEIHFGNTVSYSLWNLNRADVPGLEGKLYAVADMKFGEGSGGEAGYSSDFDFRTGVGSYLGKVGPGNLVVEFYTLEEDRPIAFAMLYRF